MLNLVAAHPKSTSSLGLEPSSRRNPATWPNEIATEVAPTNPISYTGTFIAAKAAPTNPISYAGISIAAKVTPTNPISYTGGISIAAKAAPTTTNWACRAALAAIEPERLAIRPMLLR